MSRTAQSRRRWSPRPRPRPASGGAHVPSSTRQVPALAPPRLRGRHACRRHAPARRASIRRRGQVLLVAGIRGTPCRAPSPPTSPGDPRLRRGLPLACTGRKVRFGSSGWSEAKERGMGGPAGGGGAPGGGAERKLVTVLAVDLDEPVKDFEERDPEDVRAMLAGHVERVRAEVEGFGGAVEHADAGRALAVFGVPRTREDDAERAVRAALT